MQLQTRASGVAVVPRQFGIYKRADVLCRSPVILVGYPEAPCRQVVLGVEVIPFGVESHLSVLVVVQSVAQIETGDKRHLLYR